MKRNDYTPDRNPFLPTFSYNPYGVPFPYSQPMGFMRQLLKLFHSTLKMEVVYSSEICESKEKDYRRNRPWRPIGL
jgi:hypothetical protein